MATVLEYARRRGWACDPDKCNRDAEDLKALREAVKEYRREQEHPVKDYRLVNQRREQVFELLDRQEAKSND